ncbi:uncharacterized protein LOC119677879 isoform X2 [Teleopsis dalmanni]|uniref:uncharacterized protein LOC119677879 isoform X2 n=1 Tax=Teleopsis dalmanni TaxID=139649 RepID=UPI0018CD9D01|nr:uncharacterized protein LOC119677879 isoform X2 [Teleopsis dalmanni]
MGRFGTYQKFDKRSNFSKQEKNDNQSSCKRQLREGENFLDTLTENKCKFSGRFDTKQNSSEPPTSTPEEVISPKSWLFANSEQESLIKFEQKCIYPEEIENKPNELEKIRNIRNQQKTSHEINCKCGKNQHIERSKAVLEDKGLFPQSWQIPSVELENSNKRLEKTLYNQYKVQNKKQKYENQSSSAKKQLSKTSEKNIYRKTEIAPTFGISHLSERFNQSKNFESNVVTPTDSWLFTENVEVSLITFNKKLQDQCCNENDMKSGKVTYKNNSKIHRTCAQSAETEIPNNGSWLFQDNKQDSLIAFNKKIGSIDEAPMTENENKKLINELRSETLKIQSFGVIHTPIDLDFNDSYTLPGAERISVVKSKSDLEIPEKNCMRNMYLSKASTRMNDAALTDNKLHIHNTEGTLIAEASNKPNELDVHSETSELTFQPLSHMFTQKQVDPKYKFSTYITNENISETKTSKEKFCSKENFQTTNEQNSSLLSFNKDRNKSPLWIPNMFNGKKNLPLLDYNRLALEDNWIFTKPLNIVICSNAFAQEVSNSKVVSFAKSKSSLKVHIEDNWIFSQPLSVCKPIQALELHENFDILGTDYLESIKGEFLTNSQILETNEASPLDDMWIFAKPLYVSKPIKTAMQKDVNSVKTTYNHNFLISKTSDECSNLHQYEIMNGNTHNNSRMFVFNFSKSNNISQRFLEHDSSLMTSDALIEGSAKNENSTLLERPYHLYHTFSLLNLFPTMTMSRQVQELIESDLRNIDVRLLTYKELAIVAVSNKYIGDTKLPLKERQRIELEQRRHAERFELVNQNRFGLLWEKIISDV